MIRALFIVFAFVMSMCCWAVEANEGSTAVGEKSIAQRVAGRTFPSVFQAWGRADNIKGQDELSVMARHDLVWHGVKWYGLEWDANPSGLAEALVPESVKEGRRVRKALLKLNPNIILLAEIRYRDASRGFLPKDHQWWARDKKGNLIEGWAEGRHICLDFANPQFRQHVVRRARAVVQSGVVDGIMLDWWHDDEHRLALVKAVREAIGDKYLIIANVNERITAKSAAYINGYFMECTKSETARDWQTIAATLTWAEKNLREPHVNCVETWYHKSRMDLNLMRAVTTLTLTYSNGYCLFSDPNPLPSADHLHNWYPFWNKTLGKPASKGIDKEDGTVVREFENGTVVYNPPGNKSVTVTFGQLRTSLATGQSSQSHTVNSWDGDIFLRKTLYSPTTK
ncbi:MAG: hypothetical protein ACETVZ_07200 [Phycisphaerae bacterium]